MAQEDVEMTMANTPQVLEECAPSNSHSTPTQSFSLCSSHLGNSDSAPTTSVSGPYFSTRIHSLSKMTNDLENKLGFEIECSKSHWTELPDSEDEEERVSDSDMFERLKKHPEWGPFFRRESYKLEIGEKIAEGGQAEIFRAFGTNSRDPPRTYKDEFGLLKGRDLVVKVFKTGYRLQNLQRLWPHGLAEAALPHRYFKPDHLAAANGEGAGNGLCWALDAQLLMDDRFAGRFAFVFDRYWGDLRKLIDMRMLETNGSPPFSMEETFSILINIAKGMALLHKFGLLHRDLKASNVLMICNTSIYGNKYSAYIADFESSVGINGTGFWRAPEVLRAVKKRRLTGDSVPEDTFTQQTDVYSFAMTCYEVIAGKFPFEGREHDGFDFVLSGERPPLPDDSPAFWKKLLSKCWDKNPSKRPSFEKIVGMLQNEKQKTLNTPIITFSAIHAKYFLIIILYGISYFMSMLVLLKLEKKLALQKAS